MKILFFNHNPLGYGTYYRCFYLGKYLSQYGHNTTLICASDKNFDFHISTRDVNSGMRVISLPRVKYHKYYTGQLLRTFLGSLQSLVFKYDLAHGFAVAQPPTGVPTLVSKVFRRKPVVVDWDDLWGGGFAEYHNVVVGDVLEMLEETIPPMADKVTVVSDLLFERAKKLGVDERKIYKIPNGANIDEIKPMDRKSARKKLDLNANCPIILSLGHTYLESLVLLFKAFSNVVSEVPGTKLLIVGRVDASKEAKNVYDSMAGNIVSVGEQPFWKVPYFLAAADVLVLPMKNSPIEEARWPIRLGDYFASGRPIVSNAVGEVKKVLETEKCGLTSPPDDAKKFSEKVIELLENRELSEELGKRARQVAEEKYAWQIIARKLSKMYEEIYA